MLPMYVYNLIITQMGRPDLGIFRPSPRWVELSGNRLLVILKLGRAGYNYRDRISKFSKNFNIFEKKWKFEPSIRTRLTTRFDKTSFKKAITQITKNYIKLQKAMNKDSFEDKNHEDYSKACKIAQRKLVSGPFSTDMTL